MVRTEYILYIYNKFLVICFVVNYRCSSDAFVWFAAGRCRRGSEAADNAILLCLLNRCILQADDVLEQLMASTGHRSVGLFSSLRVRFRYV